MTDPPIDPSVFQEPHLTHSHFELDPSERLADQTLGRSTQANLADPDRSDSSVFDEPAYSGPVPEEALTYSRWIERKNAETTLAQSMGMTGLLVLAAGPWAVLGALVQSGTVDVRFHFGGIPLLIAVAVLAPVVEEVMKVAAALYVVERRPYFFKSAWQIALCALSGGLVFGVLENLIYLNVYIRDPSPFLIQWRWIVCTSLHVVCTGLAGLGLVRVWRDHRRMLRPPNISLAFPFLAAAMVLHGLYNLFAMVVAFGAP